MTPGDAPARVSQKAVLFLQVLGKGCGEMEKILLWVTAPSTFSSHLNRTVFSKK